MKRNLNYCDKIKELTKNVPATMVDFNIPRDIARTPTQASSNFITNKEQGDWAENLITRAINENSKNYIAVKYGKSDNLVAGEYGFEQILKIISNPNNEDVIFSVETDTKNQNKTTIKIDSKSGIPIAQKVDEPKHESVRKEIQRGQLLFYVTFKGGTAYLDVINLCKILGINEKEF
ncbi:MAG: AccI family restriction endonuclease [Minisyncoccia bacterium]